MFKYLNWFTQLSRYALEDVSTDARKQYMFLNGVHDEIQLQSLNSDYTNFQKLVDKAIIIENKQAEITGKRKMAYSGQSSNVQPCSCTVQPPSQQF